MRPGATSSDPWAEAARELIRATAAWGPTSWSGGGPSDLFSKHAGPVADLAARLMAMEASRSW